MGACAPNRKLTKKSPGDVELSCSPREYRVVAMVQDVVSTSPRLYFLFFFSLPPFLWNKLHDSMSSFVCFSSSPACDDCSSVCAVTPRECPTVCLDYVVICIQLTHLKPLPFIIYHSGKRACIVSPICPTYVCLHIDPTIPS